MALIHRTKVTHSYEASPQHFQKFFSTLTQMYEEQVHTDVHLVAKDGTLFGVHRVRNKYFEKYILYYFNSALIYYYVKFLGVFNEFSFENELL